jgi:hypothetical protein
MERDKDGFRRRRAPTEPVTYDQMLSILHNMRDGIDHTEDPYPKMEIRLNARDRYRRYLKSGNRMPLMAEEEETLTNDDDVGSAKRVASHPDGLQRTSKRRRVADAGVGQGRGKRMGRGRRGTHG